MLLDVDIQFSQHNLFERLSFPPLSGLDTLVENQFIAYGGFISRLSILLHWSIYLSLYLYILF